MTWQCGGTEITENNFSDIIDMENPPKIEFDEKNYNFGSVIEGTEVTHRFTFTNVGKGTLLISAVNGDCNCTVPKSWTKEQIKPGEKGFVDVIFDTKGKVGENIKNITITANTKPTNTTVQMIGNVIGPK